MLDGKMRTNFRDINKVVIKITLVAMPDCSMVRYEQTSETSSNVVIKITLLQRQH